MAKVLGGEIAEVADNGRPIAGGKQRELTLTVEDTAPGCVRLDFGIGIRSLDLTDEQAEELAKGILETAKKARSRRTQ